MKRRSRILPFGLWLLGVGYVVCVAWVLTHGAQVLPERKVTIRLAHWQIEKGPPDGIDAVIKRYEALHPNVKVEQMLVPGAVYRQWLRTTLAGGTAPDLIEYGIWLENVRDVPLRYFEPVTDWLMEPNSYNKGTALQGVPWLKTFADELLEQRSNSPEPGQYYSVTLSRGSQRLFGNLKLLREITGAEQVPATLPEFFALCEKARCYGRKRGRDLMPLAGARDNTMYFSEIYLGGMLTKLTFSMDRDGLLSMDSRQLEAAYLQNRWQWNQPEVRGALGVIAKLCAEMKPGFLQLGRDDAVQQFMRGDALFIFSGTFDATSLRRLADFPVGAFRVPQPTHEDPLIGPYLAGRFLDGDNSTGFGLYLNRESPHHAEAIDFLRFLTSHEGGQIFTSHSGWVSSIRDVPVPPELASDLSPIDGYAASASYSTLGTESGRLFWREFYRLTGPRGSVKEFTAALDAAMPEAFTADLSMEVRNQRLTLAPRDVRIAAVGELARRAPQDAATRLRRERLESAQNQSEGIALYYERELREAATAGGGH